MSEETHFEHTKNYTDPKLRYFNGHFITAKQLKELQVTK
jgi:hypothetical protein